MPEATTLSKINSALDASISQPPEMWPKDIIELTNRSFECCQYVDQEYPDDIAQWPKDHADCARAAAKKLAHEAERPIVETMSRCITSDNPRFPSDSGGKKFGLLYSVLLGEAE